MKTIWGSFFLGFFLLAALVMPAGAQQEKTVAEKALERPRDLTLISTGIVKQIIKSDMVLLDDNLRYELDNIRVPVEYSQNVTDELTTQFLNKKVNIYTSHAEDTIAGRYGLPLVHIVREEDDLWMQEDLVIKGLAWAFSSVTSRKMATPLRKAEDGAREQRAGFWADANFAIKNPKNVHDYINSYQIVEGVVTEVKSKKLILFINFDKDWKTDFTIMIPQRSVGFMCSIPDLLPPFSWEGQRVRVRGWVEDDNGPMIQLTHPEQVEIIPQK